MTLDDVDLTTDEGVRAMLLAVESENLRKIFGPGQMPIETDEDLLTLAELVDEDE